MQKRTVQVQIYKSKARLFFCGNQQTQFYNEIFAPVVEFTVVRLVISIAVQNNDF